MKTRHSTLFLLLAIMIISVSIGTVSAGFAYYEGDVQSAVGYGYFDIGDFVYGSFSSVDELKATLLDANKSEEVSNKYFGSTMKVSQDDEGNINLSSTSSSTKSVLFTPEFIYELQQLGVRTIHIGKITTSAGFNNNVISYTDYTGVGRTIYASNGLTLDISSTKIFPDGSGGYYYLDENGNQVEAQSVTFKTALFNYSWKLDSVSFN